MPQAAPRPCVHPGCGALVHDGSGHCVRHPGNAFAEKARGTRHERGYGSAWDQLRKIVLRRDKGLCQVCRKAAARAVDHIVNKAQGGTDDLDNLQAICRRCHDAKTATESLAGRGWAGR